MTKLRTEATGLPSGYESAVMGPRLNLTKEQIPWFESGSETIQLAKISLSGSDQFQFYLGSAIKGKKLIRAANQLDSHRSNITNNLLNTCLPDLIRTGYSPIVKLVDGAVGSKSIYYAFNHGGQRVYFMRFDDALNGGESRLPIIIRVAVCDKANQADVLSVITNKSAKTIKARGKL